MMSNNLQLPLMSTTGLLLERIVKPREHNLPSSVTQWIMDTVQFEPEEIARMRELNGKASAGTLSSSEGNELDRFIEMGREMDVIRAYARHAGKLKASQT